MFGYILSVSWMCLWVEVYVHVQGCLSSPLLYAELVWKMKPFGRMSCRKIEEASVQNTTDRHIITYSIRIVMLWRHALMAHDNVLSLCDQSIAPADFDILNYFFVFFFSGKIIKDTYAKLTFFFYIWQTFPLLISFSLNLISVTVVTKIKTCHSEIYVKKIEPHILDMRVLTSTSAFYLQKKK